MSAKGGKVGSLIMSSLMVVVFGVVVMVSLGYPKAARLAPLAVAGMALVLALVQFGKDIYAIYRKKGEEVASGEEKEKKKKGKEGGMPLLHTVGWLLLYFGGILACGFWLTTLVYTVVFLKFVSKRTWLGSVVPSVVFTGTLYWLFELLLNVAMFQGFLFGASFE